jgi:hypothetical protein
MILRIDEEKYFFIFYTKIINLLVLIKGIFSSKAINMSSMVNQGHAVHLTLFNILKLDKVGHCSHGWDINVSLFIIILI